MDGALGGKMPVWIHSPLYRYLMAEGPPDRSKAVPAFFDYVALACIFGFVDALIAGRPWWVWLGALAAAVAFHLAGIHWTTIRSGLNHRLSDRVELLAQHPRGVIAVIAVGAFAVILVYLSGIRNDLNTYVLPRTLTKAQRERKTAMLQSYSPLHVVNVAVNGTDQEAVRYASQLINVITAAGWKTRFWTIDPVNPPQEHQIGGGFVNLWLTSDTGIIVRVCYDSAKRPELDPKHPSEELILAEAFAGNSGGDFSGIMVNNNAPMDCGSGAITLEVGRRPLILPPEGTPLRILVGEWIMRHFIFTQD